VTASIVSVQSQLLTPEWQGKKLSSATGFIVVHDARPYLITNWHVLSGRNAETGEPLSSHGVTPDAVGIRHFWHTQLGEILPHDFVEPVLAEDQQPRWLEHPQYRRKVDVVALPLGTFRHAAVFPYNLEPPAQLLRAGVSEFVHIVGFPFGLKVKDFLAIWVRGSIASDPDVDFDDLPCFLIDARTRQGQSGAPVIAYSPGGATIMADSSLALRTSPLVNLLGVYSGRVNAESDIGKVWKIHVVREILENGIVGSDR
jgi:Trypsin-like peptidase domain